MKRYGVTIQMKSAEQFFPVLIFIMPYKVVQTFYSVNEIVKSGQAISGGVVLFCIR